MEDILVRYFHFIGILLLTAMLAIQNLLIKPELDRTTLKKLALVDTLYGLGAIIAFAAGLLLWMAVGKPADFYTKNPIFHGKMTVFIIVALISIYPTIFFLKNRNKRSEITAVPRSIIISKRIELGFLLILPFLAVLVAQGLGYRG